MNRVPGVDVRVRTMNQSVSFWNALWREQHLIDLIDPKSLIFSLVCVVL